MTRIVLIRHGAVNLRGIAYGQRVDPALSAAGRGEVGSLRQRLQLTGVSATIRSPAMRTEESAELLGLQPDQIDPRWSERDLGSWEGRPWDELWTEVDPAILTDPARYAAFTPPGGEPLPDLRSRTSEALEDVGARHGVEDPAGHPPVVVVCHAGTIVAAVGHVLGLDDVATLRLRPQTATATWLTRWGDGSWTLERLAS